MTYEEITSILLSGTTRQKLEAMDYFYANVTNFADNEVKTLATMSRRVTQRVNEENYVEYYRQKGGVTPL